MSLPEDRSGDEARTYRAEKFDSNNPIHAGAIRSIKPSPTSHEAGERVNPNVHRTSNGKILFPASRFAGGKTLEEHGLEKQTDGYGPRHNLVKKGEARTKDEAAAKKVTSDRAAMSGKPTPKPTTGATNDNYANSLRAKEERKKRAIAESNARLAAAKAAKNKK